MTFKNGEIAPGIRQQLSQQSSSSLGTDASDTTSETRRSRSGIITTHSCNVTYPDSQQGTCRYTRGGPAWHIFRFEHVGKNGKRTALPVQNATDRQVNTIAAIEENTHRLASAAFSEAVRRERREYFQRALPPPYQKIALPPQMKVKEAKASAGRYALCLRVGSSLLPTGDTWETLDEAVSAWRAAGNEVRVKFRQRSLVIGCCCRWKRRWEQPCFNSLHADPHYGEHGLPGADQHTACSMVNKSTDPEEATDPLAGEELPPPDDRDVPPESIDTSPDLDWTNEPLDEGDGLP